MPDDDKNKASGPSSKPVEGKADVRSRFATPIEADQPVNPDETSVEQFTPPARAEQRARETKNTRTRR